VDPADKRPAGNPIAYAINPAPGYIKAENGTYRRRSDVGAD
jgi:hypothetical protein